MTPLQHIALVGLPAVGKSTIGKRLAKAIYRPFVDADDVVERESGRTIAELFAIAGEPAFRESEHAVVARTLRGATPVVFATGGGAVLDARNRQLLREYAFTVYLRRSEGSLVARLSRSQHRPLLTGDGLEARLRMLNGQRAPLYAEVACLIIDVDKHSMREVVAHIATQCRERGSVAP